MIKKRKQYRPEFKAKVALVALEMHWKLPGKADFAVFRLNPMSMSMNLFQKAHHDAAGRRCSVQSDFFTG
jgi:hypothetical protein